MSPAALRSALSFLFAALVLQVVFVGSTLALSRWLRARVRAVAIGTPAVLHITIASVRVAIGALPLMAWVDFPGRALGDADQGPGSWRRLGIGVRLALIVGPWVATLLLAMMCVGTARAAGSFVHALPQLLMVVDATPLVRAFLRLLADEPIAIGVVCAKATAFNLLPLATLAGGAVVHEVAGVVRGTAGVRPRGPVSASVVCANTQAHGRELSSSGGHRRKIKWTAATR